MPALRFDLPWMLLPLIWGSNSEKIWRIVWGRRMSDWFRSFCIDSGLLNEAVMCVCGWLAGCPAASCAFLCCLGLIELREEAHFRVIYHHPNTSCLLYCRLPPPWIQFSFPFISPLLLSHSTTVGTWAPVLQGAWIILTEQHKKT